MFVFHFHHRLTWYYKKIMESDPLILWKITVSGPFVTLYSNNEYIFIANNNYYNIVRPFFVEHISAHDENLVENLISSELRHEHTHVTLPCNKNMVTELRELLEFIGEHNTKTNKLIDSDLIDECIAAYQSYLNSASLDEHKKNVCYLLMRWIGTDINYEKSLPFLLTREADRFLEVKSLNNTNQLDFDKIGTSIIHFLDCPNQYSFEQFGNVMTEIFSHCPRLGADSRNKIFELMPLSSTHLFNRFLGEHPIFSFFSGIMIIKMLNMLSLNGIVLLLVYGSPLYSPSLAEKGFAFLSKCVNGEDRDGFNSLALAEIRKKNKGLLLFSDSGEMDESEVAFKPINHHGSSV